MSYRKFSASNTTKGTKNIFDERGKYRNEAVPSRLKNKYPGLFRDFWFIENMYYGRIDQNHKFILLDEDNLRSSSGEGGRAIYLVDFVSHALDDFLKEHRKAFSTSKIQKNDEFLSEINPFAGHKRLLTAYDLYMNDLRNKIHKKMIRAHNTIQDFDDFINFFLNEIFLMDQVIPVTLTGFVASRHSSPLGTGLFVDLVDLADDDAPKVTKVIDRPNFEFMMNNANRHGFMIDYNKPTRLCANLGSPQMESYMKLYNTNSSDIFNDYYSHIYTLDHAYFMNYMRKFYNKFVSLRPNIRKETKTFNYIIKKQKISIYELNNKYNENYRINLYVDLRNYESGGRYTDSLVELMKENALSYLNIQGLERALEYVDYQYIGFLNDPYAYNGVVTARNMVKDRSFSRQGLRDMLLDSVADSRKTFY